MRKIIIFLLLFGSIKAYPQIIDDFDWTNTYGLGGSIDQIYAGPCVAISGTKMMEMQAEMQFQEPGNGGILMDAWIDLSVQHWYSYCAEILYNEENIDIQYKYVKEQGIVNFENLSYEYPILKENLPDCEFDDITEGYKYRIGGYEYAYSLSDQPFNITNDFQLKQSILKYGPHVLKFNNLGGFGHSLLFIGWKGNQWRVFNTWSLPGLPVGKTLYTTNFSDCVLIIRLRGISSFVGPDADYYTLKQPDADGDGYCNFTYGDLPSNCTTCIGRDANPYINTVGGYTDYGNSINIHNVTDQSLSQEFTTPTEYRFTIRVRLLPGFHFKAKPECSIFKVSKSVSSKSARELQDPKNINENIEIISSIFPNPTNGTLSVNLNIKPEKPVSIEIIDLLGKVCFKTEISDEVNNIDLSAIPIGTYIARIINNDFVTSQKIIKN